MRVIGYFSAIMFLSSQLSYAQYIGNGLGVLPKSDAHSTCEEAVNSFNGTVYAQMSILGPDSGYRPPYVLTEKGTLKVVDSKSVQKFKSSKDEDRITYILGKTTMDLVVRYLTKADRFQEWCTA